MRINLKFLLVFIGLFLLPTALGQEMILPPAEVEFYVQPIYAEPVEDYTGIPKILGLKGDLDYLDIIWNFYYCQKFSPEGNCTLKIPGELGAKCYLNCPNPENDIETNCVDYKVCDYEGSTGKTVCTAKNPKYNFTKENNIVCKFYNPEDPEKHPYVYPNTGKLPSRNFWPIKYELTVSPELKITLGGPTEIKINIMNLGLIPDSYTANLSTTDLNLRIEQHSPKDEISYGKIATAIPKVYFFATGDYWFELLVKSNKNPITCSDNGNCSYLGDAKCASDDGLNKCWKRNEIRIKVGPESLPEFSWTGIIQIMILAVALILIKF